MKNRCDWYCCFRLLLVTKIFFVMVATGQLAGQLDSTAISDSPFRKGRFIVGASAFLNSSNINYRDLDLKDTTYSNNYSFALTAGYTVIDRLLLGVYFNADRIHTTELITRDLEILTVGPFARYYLSKSSEGSVYVGASLGYARLRDELLISVNNITLNRLTLGNGVSTSIGVGYSYVLYDHVALNMVISYTAAFFDAQLTDNVTNIVSNTDVVNSNFIFGVGIEVLLDN